MKMVNVKLEKKSKKELAKEGMVTQSTMERDEYPWNLRVRFETEQVKKIEGMEELDTKDKVRMVAMCSVTSKSINKKSDGKDSVSVELQIEEVGMEIGKGDGKSMKEFMDERNSRKGKR